MMNFSRFRIAGMNFVRFSSNSCAGLFFWYIGGGSTGPAPFEIVGMNCAVTFFNCAGLPPKILFCYEEWGGGGGCEVFRVQFPPLRIWGLK